MLRTTAARRMALALVGVVLVLVVLLGSLVARQSTADGFDRAVDTPVISWLGGQHSLLGWLALPGTPQSAVVVTMVLAAACLRARRLNGAILALAAVPVSTGLDEELIKPLVHRTYLGAFTFPSGHTTTAMALTTTIAVLWTAGPARARVPGAMAVTAAFVVTCVVAVAVIALRWHYFTDTVAGVAVGGGTVCALALVLDQRLVRHLLTPRGVGVALERPGGAGWSGKQSS